MAVFLTVPALAAGGDIVVFYTNDVHTYIDNGVDDENALTYSKVAALKASEENAILVDAGDHIQGTAYGGMDNGATIVRLMDAAGYDAASLAARTVRNCTPHRQTPLYVSSCPVIPCGRSPGRITAAEPSGISSTRRTRRQCIILTSFM